MTNIIKLRFLRNGQPHGREYAYLTPEEVMVGDIVEVDSQHGITKGIITQVDVPEDQIASFADRVKFIIGKVPTA
jgi:hypothetical protein